MSAAHLMMISPFTKDLQFDIEVHKQLAAVSILMFYSLRIG